MKNIRNLKGHRSRRGAMLLSAIFVVASAVMLSAFVTTMASVANEDAETHRARVRAQYLAEGALALAERDLIERYTSGDGSQQATFYLELAGGDLADLFEEKGQVQVGSQDVPYSVELVTAPADVVGQHEHQPGVQRLAVLA